ncbi:hypothetical protein ANI02nite_18570 [Acetobacter nitrogenifigens DSM 23921 = NBRC 105050]|uniref:Uncharacterized protein n=1 Tax=Acetobacter nitrogenifigens DSM 23921 = NBRC 105050 TaxID=1120919 RepID=A0A511XAI4_9PROT|nr:hypothetical protein ANI02nite_18570 [Acetobacter nitrogenifigens DSM 23921 = NBRC 105050]
MANVPPSKDGVSASPSIATDSAAPVSGTPSIAIDIVVAGSQVLAAFTAQKQNAVARGPTNKADAQKVTEPSPVNRPSEKLAPETRTAAASVICQGAKSNADELALKWRKCRMQNAQHPAAMSNIALAPRIALFVQSIVNGLMSASTPIRPKQIPKMRHRVARSAKKAIAAGATQIGVV